MGFVVQPFEPFGNGFSRLANDCPNNRQDRHTIISYPFAFPNSTIRLFPVRA
jgi:hypothetical protein